MPTFPALWVTFAILAAAAGVGVNRFHAKSIDLISTGLILTASLLLGTTLGQLDAYRYPANHISQFTTASQRLSQIELRLNDPPHIYAPTFGQAYPMPPKQTMIADVTAVRIWEGWEPANGKILVTINEPHPELNVGQRVRVLGMLDRPAPAMNPGQFDWAEYYRAQGVLASLHVPHAGNVIIVEQNPPSLTQRWRQWTRDKLANGFADNQSLDHALLRALVLGDRDPELRNVQEQFRATGTSHHLAISGMHIAVMGGMVFLIARLLRLTPRQGWCLAMTFVFIYGLAALPSPPVVRSVLLWFAIGLAIMSRRALNLVQLLALVVMCMLIYQPMDLFNAGFQLSFCTVLGLTVLTYPIARTMTGTQKSEEHNPAVKWLLRFAAYVDSQIILVLSAGLAAWLVSMPIIASHFSQLNPWAIFAGIVLGPVVFLSLMGGVLKIIFTALWPSLDGTWAWVAQQPVSWMRGVLDWLAKLPAGDVPLPAPPVWVVVVFYITLLLAAFNWQKPGIKVLTRIAHLTALAALLLLPFQTTLAQETRKDDLRITILYVGAGQCAVIEPPSHRTMIIDAGSLSLSDPVRKAIAPYLRWRGITELDTIAISHANSDHFSAVAELVDAYGVREVLVPDGFIECVHGNQQATEMLASLGRSERPPRSVSPGQIVPLGSDTSIEILWPPSKPSALQELSPNDQSMVLRLTHAGVRILFTGDIQDAAMTQLLKTPDRIRADVMIAPHHGSSELTTPAFIAAVQPRAMISSNDRTLTGKQTRFNEMAGKLPVLRTHTSGAVTITIDREGHYSVKPFVKSPAYTGAVGHGAIGQP